MRQPGQLMRFNDAELGIIKATFAENDDLLFLLRKFLLQFELTTDEMSNLRKQIGGTVYDVVKKAFAPEIDPDAPLFQVTDLVLGLREDMKSRGVEEMWPFFRAKQIEIDYLAERFDCLQGKIVANPVYLSELGVLNNLMSADVRMLYANITARNWLLSCIDSTLQQLKFLAGLKKESVEDTVKRLQKDSTK